MTQQRVKVIATKTEARNLKPGDLYSPLGSAYFVQVIDKQPVVNVFIKTNVPFEGGEDEIVSRLSLELTNADGSTSTYFDPHVAPGAKR